MLVGIIMLGSTAGTLPDLARSSPTPPRRAALVGRRWSLLLVGALSKSAHLPVPASGCRRAMAAPTPVSAYLHAAAMVKAGVYLVALLAPGVRRRRPAWRPVLVLGAGHDARSAAGAALRQHDLKLLLAYGTVSQLGCLSVLFGRGHPERGAGRRGDAARRTRCSRRRCSSSSASSTTPPAPGTCARSAAVGAGRCRGVRGAPCWRRPRWPACRRCSGSSPRRRPSRRSSAAGSGRLVALAGGGARVGADGRVHAAFPLGRLRRQAAACDPTPAHRVEAACSSLRRCSRSPGWRRAAGLPVATAHGRVRRQFRDPGDSPRRSGTARRLPLAAVAAGLRWPGRAAVRWPADAGGQARLGAVRRPTAGSPTGPAAGGWTGSRSRSPASPSAARCRTTWARILLVAVGVCSVGRPLAGPGRARIVAWDRPVQPVLAVLLGSRGGARVPRAPADVVLAVVVGLTGYGTAMLFLPTAPPTWR